MIALLWLISLPWKINPINLFDTTKSEQLSHCLEDNSHNKGTASFQRGVSAGKIITMSWARSRITRHRNLWVKVCFRGSLSCLRVDTRCPSSSMLSLGINDGCLCNRSTPFYHIHRCWSVFSYYWWGQFLVWLLGCSEDIFYVAVSTADDIVSLLIFFAGWFCRSLFLALTAEP